jgi:hypothetical protein
LAHTAAGLTRARSSAPRAASAVRERGSKELKPILALVTIALAKHPAVFSHGGGTFALRVLARILALLPLPMRHARCAHACVCASTARC